MSVMAGLSRAGVVPLYIKGDETDSSVQLVISELTTVNWKSDAACEAAPAIKIIPAAMAFLMAQPPVDYVSC
jgi:hypothetical protein